MRTVINPSSEQAPGDKSMTSYCTFWAVQTLTPGPTTEQRYPKTGSIDCGVECN